MQAIFAVYMYCNHNVMMKKISEENKTLRGGKINEEFKLDFFKR